MLQMDQFHIMALDIPSRFHPDKSIRISDLMDEPKVRADVRMQRSLLQHVPPPDTAPSSAPQLSVLRSATPAKIGDKPEVLAAILSAMPEKDTGTVMKYIEQGRRKSTRIQTGLIGQTTLSKPVLIDDGLIWNLVIQNASHDSFQTWSQSTKPADKYIQLATWVLLNSNDLDSKATAVAAAVALGVPDPKQLTKHDPSICRVIKNAGTRAVMPDVVNLLLPITLGTMDASAIDKFFVTRNLTRGYVDRMTAFKGIPVAYKGMAILEWLSSNATGTESDSPNAPLIKDEASRRFGQYRAQYGAPPDFSSESIVPNVQAGAEVDFINQAFTRVMTSVEGTHGYIDPKLRKELKGIAELIEGKLLPSKRSYLNLYGRLEAQTPGKYADIITRTQSDIEEYENALRNFHEMFSTDTTDLAAQLKALYTRAADLEKSGLIGNDEYVQITTIDIPNMQDRLRAGLSGKGKGYPIVNRRITAKLASELYETRAKDLEKYAEAHSNATWAMHPMHCPFGRIAIDLLSDLAKLDLRVSRFKSAVRYLHTTIIPKLRARADRDYAQLIEVACQNSSSFAPQHLIDAIRSKDPLPFHEMHTTLSEIEKSIVRAPELLTLARKIFDSQLALGHVPVGQDQSTMNLATPMSNYAMNQIRALLSAYNVALPPPPEPEPQQQPLAEPEPMHQEPPAMLPPPPLFQPDWNAVDDTGYLGSIYDDPFLAELNYMPPPLHSEQPEVAVAEPGESDILMQIFSELPEVPTTSGLAALMSHSEANTGVMEVDESGPHGSPPQQLEQEQTLPNVVPPPGDQPAPQQQQQGEDLTLQDAELGLLDVVESGSEMIEGSTSENRVRYTTVLQPNQYSGLGACPAVVPGAVVPAGHMRTRISFVPSATPSDMLMTTVGRALALAPDDPNTTRRAYAVIVSPILNMLREYGRLIPDYTYGDNHSVRGLSTILRYTAQGAPPFPSFPFSEIDTFTTRFNNVIRQYPLRIGLEVKKRHEFACLSKCSGLTDMLPDGMDMNIENAFSPVWFNVTEDGAHSLGSSAPLDSVVVPFWSPMPDVMNARPPEFSVPDGFIMPNTLSTKKTMRSTGVQELSKIDRSAYASFNSTWRQDAYGNRIFLVPKGRIEPGACAYRLGRFVSKCNSVNDMYYAWQAEMGSFEDVKGKAVFMPRQHVSLVFSHSSSMARMQFNNRAQTPGSPILINGPHMQNYCGTILVKCCVPAECPTSGYENGPWYCGVFGTFDGTLRSFLDGPDMEMHDIYGGGGYENLRSEMLKYSSNGIVPYDMRFKPTHKHTPLDYWSRMITFVHVMRDVLDDIEAVLKSHAHIMIGVCPENFVYDTRGMSLANVANSLYLKSPAGLDHSAAYFRSTNYDIAMARRFMRRDFYNFKMLGIGSSCNFSYANVKNAQKDAGSRCLPLDMPSVFAEYPSRHASDPFLPHNVVNMSPSLSQQQLADNRISITCEQSIILARYVFFKMGLCAPDAYMFAAHLQSSLRGAVTGQQPQLGACFSMLAGYAYDTHDIGLLFAQEPEISSLQGYPPFAVPEFIRDMLTANYPTPVTTELNQRLIEITTLLGENTEINDLGSDPANVAVAFALGTYTPRNKDMYTRFSRLRGLASRVIEIVNSTVPPESRTMPDQIDITPLT